MRCYSLPSVQGCYIGFGDGEHVSACRWLTLPNPTAKSPGVSPAPKDLSWFIPEATSPISPLGSKMDSDLVRRLNPIAQLKASLDSNASFQPVGKTTPPSKRLPGTESRAATLPSEGTLVELYFYRFLLTSNNISNSSWTSSTD